MDTERVSFKSAYVAAVGCTVMGSAVNAKPLRHLRTQICRQPNQITAVCKSNISTLGTSARLYGGDKQGRLVQCVGVGVGAQSNISTG